ncbi:MAG: hypothetical protein Q9186_005003 [Xanthomendoza sp. 1 TL-2023]
MDVNTKVSAITLPVSSNKQPDSPTLTWSSLQHLLENAVPHVLIILDCCYAANAARDTSEGTTKELLAACGRENPTLGVGIRSFTSALIEELQAFGNSPFTVAMLHSRLITMRWRLAFTPVYALLSEHGGHSIELAPLSALPPTAQLLDLDASHMNDDSMDICSPEEKVMADTRVLLTVSIADDATCDIVEWKKWLVSQAPWDVTRIDVKVEAFFRSHSTMLITSMPIVAWDGLSNKAAYRFTGFIKSENLDRKPISPELADEDQIPTHSDKLLQMTKIDSSHKTQEQLTPLFPPTPNITPVIHFQNEFNAESYAKNDTTPTSVKSPMKTNLFSEKEPPDPSCYTTTGPNRRRLSRRYELKKRRSHQHEPPAAAWTKSMDDVLLLAKHRGLDFAVISEIYFPTQSAQACHVRYEKLRGSRPIHEVINRLGNLANYYRSSRENMWRILASKMGEEWTAVEAEVSHRAFLVPTVINIYI